MNAGWKCSARTSKITLTTVHATTMTNSAGSSIGSGLPASSMMVTAGWDSTHNSHVTGKTTNAGMLRIPTSINGMP